MISQIRFYRKVAPLEHAPTTIFSELKWLSGLVLYLA